MTEIPDAAGSEALTSALDTLLSSFGSSPDRLHAVSAAGASMAHNSSAERIDLNFFILNKSFLMEM